LFEYYSLFFNNISYFCLAGICYSNMNDPETKKLIKEYEYLFWYTPANKKENISKELLVETFLNYGDLNAIKKLFNVLGIKEAARVFFNAKGRKKLNYYPEIYNYFSLYFRKNAQRNTE